MRKKLKILFDGNPSNKYYQLIDKYGQVTLYNNETQFESFTTIIIDCQNPSKVWGSNNFQEILNANLGLVLLEPDEKNWEDLANIINRKLNGPFHGIITKILNDSNDKPYYFCDAVHAKEELSINSLSFELTAKINERVVQAISFSSTPPCSENGLLPNVDKSPMAIINDEFRVNYGIKIRTDYYFYHENAVTGGTGSLNQYYAILLSTFIFDFTLVHYGNYVVHISPLSPDGSPLPQGVMQMYDPSPTNSAALQYKTVLLENKINMNMRVIENGAPVNKSFSPSYCQTRISQNIFGTLFYFGSKKDREKMILEFENGEPTDNPDPRYGTLQFVFLMPFQFIPTHHMNTFGLKFKYDILDRGVSNSFVRGPWNLTDLTKIDE